MMPSMQQLDYSPDLSLVDTSPSSTSVIDISDISTFRGFSHVCLTVMLRCWFLMVGSSWLMFTS